MKIPEILLIDVQRRPGSLSRVLAAVAEEGLVVESLEAVRRTPSRTTWELTVEVEEERLDALRDALDALDCSSVAGFSDRVFDRHRGGKIRQSSGIDIDTPQVLRDVYTPGVARVCRAIERDPELAHEYTIIGRTVGIVTNGTAILGLGDIGPVAGMPVMEGKAALFSTLADLTGVPILTEARDPDTVVAAVKAIAPTFGAIQLEDIGAPECFEIEERLIEEAGVPVLHDDQHGTAVVALAAVLSATRSVGREVRECVVGQVGLGAAGQGIARLLDRYGVRGLIGADLDPEAIARFEGSGGQGTTLDEVLARADVVVATTGVPGLIRPAAVRDGQVVLALSNPDPEITPESALAAGAAFAADGRSVNNVLGFPGLFRGVLEARAPRFTPAMLIAAAETIAAHTPEGALVPDALDRTVHDAVADAVRAVAMGPR